LLYKVPNELGDYAASAHKILGGTVPPNILWAALRRQHKVAPNSEDWSITDANLTRSKIVS